MTSIELRQATPLAITKTTSPSSYASLINTNSLVVVKHPGYPDEFGENCLLELYAWDINSNNRRGLHTSTAATACALVACNSWDGYLSTDREGRAKVDSYATDDVLPAGTYYFHVPYHGLNTALSSPYKYPIYPSFEHWTFPHAQLPPIWNNGDGEIAGAGETGSQTNAVDLAFLPSTPSPSTATAAVLARDQACTLSGDSDYMQRAHLCTRNELIWFRKNSMRRYNDRRELSGDNLTDDSANALAMRPDIHQAFDACNFVIVPKNRRWVVHFLEKTKNLGSSFHNMPVSVLATVKPEFILARLAWAVFPLVKSFMELGPSRLVRVRVEAEDGAQEVQRTITPVEFSELESKRSRSRSHSPKKRKASLPVIPDDTSSAKSRRLDDSSLTDTPSLYYEDEGGQETQHESLGEHEDDNSEEGRIAKLRTRKLRKRRPNHDPSLICCDYSLAEEKNAAGISGPAEYGGGHLCMECLGVEYSPMSAFVGSMALSPNQSGD